MSAVTPCFIGVDVGTSGCRAIAVDADRRILAQARTALPPPVRRDEAGVEQDAELWWRAVVTVLRELVSHLGSHEPGAICVDATSSTLLLCTPEGTPLAPALMYNDARSQLQAAAIAAAAPITSAARGSGSSLAKLLWLKSRLSPRPGTLALHQADWIIGRLTGHFGVSDWNNCLKLGYDPESERWPDWIHRLDLGPVELPRVLAPGAVIGTLSRGAAAITGLPETTRVTAGTTDSTAAVIATGAANTGDAISSLGSTLVLKVVSPHPVTAPEYGIYSHRFGDRWLAGGASNTGGAVIKKFFDDERIAQLTRDLRPDQLTGLDYYPLLAPGERFPINDPRLPPRLEPRPEDDLRFFQGLLEGIARIEAEGYRRLRAVGAPAPDRILSIGGGAKNPGWTRIREHLLGLAVEPAAIEEAAYGAALLALGSRRRA